jgi:hypothetical protein
MLSARRDPIFDHGTHDAPSPPHSGHAAGHVAPPPTSFARFIAAAQIIGTVLAVPLGLASGYSIYRANFSPEAKCDALRTSIIAMLDKNADASTLRLLVHRDVASFERTCGKVDPDAVAAFKTLLAKPQAVAAAKETKPAKPRVETAVKEAKPAKPHAVAAAKEAKPTKPHAAVAVKETKAAKLEKQAVRAAPAERPAHAVVARLEPAKRVAAKPEPARHNPDADWLAAVRRALVEHSAVTRARAAEAPVPLAPPPAVRPMAQPMGTPLPAPPQAHAAPPLPPATSVADAPAPQSDDADHPVPPAPIPNVGPGPVR